MMAEMTEKKKMIWIKTTEKNDGEKKEEEKTEEKEFCRSLTTRIARNAFNCETHRNR